MREMHSKYKIVGAPGSPPGTPLASSVTPECPRVGLIADLILAVISAAKFDHYLVFKLFERFPEVRAPYVGVVLGAALMGDCLVQEDLQAALDYLKSWNSIKLFRVRTLGSEFLNS